MQPKQFYMSPAAEAGCHLKHFFDNIPVINFSLEYDLSKWKWKLHFVQYGHSIAILVRMVICDGNTDERLLYPRRTAVCKTTNGVSTMPGHLLTATGAREW